MSTLAQPQWASQLEPELGKAQPQLVLGFLLLQMSILTVKTFLRILVPWNLVFCVYPSNYFLRFKIFYGGLKPFDDDFPFSLDSLVQDRHVKTT
jgi:hypothetical protein